MVRRCPRGHGAWGRGRSCLVFFPCATPGNTAAHSNPTPTPHPHRGAVQGSACHKRTALPGVGCRRLLGPDLGTMPGPSPPWPPPWHPPRSHDAGERMGPVWAGGLGGARSSPSFVLHRLCLGLSCLGGSLSWGCSVLDGPCHAVVVPPLVSWEFVFRPQGLTLALTCCRKPERRRSVGWRQSGAALCSVRG